MTTNSGPDPVNRWATEHYGFADDEPDPGAGTTHPSPSIRHPLAAPTSPTPAAPLGRRRRALVAAGVLVASLVAGFGGVAVAAGAASDGGVGGRGDGRDVTVLFAGDDGRGSGVGDGDRGFGRR